MDKGKFLKTTSNLAGAALVSPLLKCNPKAEKMASTAALYNWAGNLQFSTIHIHNPFIEKNILGNT